MFSSRASHASASASCLAVSDRAVSRQRCSVNFVTALASSRLTPLLQRKARAAFSHAFCLVSSRSQFWGTNSSNRIKRKRDRERNRKKERARERGSERERERERKSVANFHFQLCHSRWIHLSSDTWSSNIYIYIYICIYLYIDKYLCINCSDWVAAASSAGGSARGSWGKLHQLPQPPLQEGLPQGFEVNSLPRPRGGGRGAAGLTGRVFFHLLLPYNGAAIANFFVASTNH